MGHFVTQFTEGWGGGTKDPNLIQLFNLFYHQDNFAGSTICHENYDN